MRLEHPVSEEYLKLIGDITVSFAMLENTLSMLVHSLIGVDQRVGFTITSEMSFRQLRELVHNLYTAKNGNTPTDTDLIELRTILQKMVEVEEQRNQITHSIWAVGSKVDTVTRLKIKAKDKKGLKFDKFEITKKDLERIVIDIKTLAFNTQNMDIRLIETGKACS